MREIAYINSNFIDLNKAVVPINDRGYLFADGIYEVVVTRNGRPFLLAEHLARLQRSADAILLQLPLTPAEITDIIERGLNESGFGETLVYIQITRGIEPRRHNYSDNLKANLTMTFRPHPEYDPNLTSKGAAIITVPEIRWQRCDIKSIALLPNIMMKQKAVACKAQEALFVSSSGLIREATAANIFFVKDKVLYTPPADHHILNGISRAYIIRQAARHGVDLIERECSLAETLAADEVFITSSTIDLLPVNRIDDTTIADGRPGPLSKTVKTWFPVSTSRENPAIRHN
ncbi:MAG: aminotransferase class IV [Deltaproteobacteria bacterium]|nr:aminotransferase class IV [Deltaproteobacteria bacterium]